MDYNGLHGSLYNIKVYLNGIMCLDCIQLSQDVLLRCVGDKHGSFLVLPCYLC
jgi:hypothetical protein